MHVVNDSTIPLGLMAKSLAALRRLLRLPQPLPQPPQPDLLAALVAQVPRVRTVHQAQELRALAASWLAAPQRRQLEASLQQQLLALAANPLPHPSPKSTWSKTRTARRTGKPRR